MQSSKHWIIIILPDIALYVTVSSYWNPRQIKRKPTNRSWEHNEGRMSCNNSIFNFHLDFPNFTFWSDCYNIFSYFGEIKSTPTLVLRKSSKFKRCHLAKWTTTILRGRSVLYNLFRAVETCLKPLVNVSQWQTKIIKIGTNSWEKAIRV